MGRQLLDYIDGPKVYICACCQIHLTTHQLLISKAFQGHSGKAYLFNQTQKHEQKILIRFNLDCGQAQEKAMMSGRHIVCDLKCKGCQTVIGWKYLLAYEQSQKYKEGKFIIERAFMRKSNWNT